MDRNLAEWYEQKGSIMDHAADRIFEYSELAGCEVKSAKTLADALEAEGFTVEMGIAGLPTAFKATWGSGSPRIGFLAEYDALPGIGPSKDPSVSFPANNAGHGCGHSILGTGCMGAAAAVKHAMEQQGLSGTLIFFGCPEEETNIGKVEMSKQGCFDDLDVAVAWHPDFVNIIQEKVYASLTMMEFEFHGISSHAGGMPEMGRSAMDACELMNVGVNYLREHVSKDITMHWAYNVVGEKPNVVPAYAKITYIARGVNGDHVKDAAERIVKCAKGAAIMTDTTMEYRIKSASPDQLMVKSLNKVFHDAFQQAPAPEYTAEELAYANKMRGYNGAGPIDDPMSEGVVPFYGAGENELYDGGSSDVIYVSRVCPTVTVRTACISKDTPFHSWTFAAFCNSAIGHKGMFYASKTMAEGTLMLLKDPALVKQIREEFEQVKAEKHV